MHQHGRKHAKASTSTLRFASATFEDMRQPSTAPMSTILRVSKRHLHHAAKCSPESPRCFRRRQASVLTRNAHETRWRWILPGLYPEPMQRGFVVNTHENWGGSTSSLYHYHSVGWGQLALFTPIKICYRNWGCGMR
jgi:hypothetical protein